MTRLVSRRKKLTTVTKPQSQTTTRRLNWQTGAALLVSTAALGVALWAGRGDPELAVFWLLGMAFGFVLQRSRFCFASAFRDLFLLRDARVMKGIIAGLAVATVGFTLVMSDRLPNARLDVLAPEAHVTPLSLALILGGIAFGLGMVLAGGCVSGSIYRMAEGYLGSWVAFAGIMTGLVVAAHTWNWWWRVDMSRAPRLWLPNVVGYGGAVAIFLLLFAGVYLFLLWWEMRDGMLIPVAGALRPQAETFRERLEQMYRSFFIRGWPAIIGGLVLGTLNVFLFAYEHPWRITGEIGAWGSLLAAQLGFAPPSLLGVETLAGCTLDGAGGGFFNHMTLANLGLFSGALVAALFAHEFKPRIPRKKIRYIQSLGGGVLMGYGAGLAVGCTVGAFFSAVPSLGANGFVFGLSLAIGAVLGVKVLRRIP